MAHVYLDMPIGAIPPQAARFFAVFARYEYALKASGKYALVKGDAVEAWWDAFARDLGPAFYREVRDDAVAPVLLADPPKKAGTAKSRIDLKAPPQIKDVYGLFLAVRRARNNLMHGGKYMRGYEVEHPRDDSILSDCLSVLDLALQRNAFVVPYFIAL